MRTDLGILLYLVCALHLGMIGCEENPAPLPPVLPCSEASKTQFSDLQETRPQGYEPSFSTTNFETTLPIFVIDTAGKAVVDEPRISATLFIYDNGTSNRLTDPAMQVEHIGIEIRGYSSQVDPKKQFGIELRNEDEHKKDVSLLQMSKESDWVLNGTYTDPTVMRNFVGYKLAQGFAHWSPQGRYVEVFLNQSEGELAATDYLGLFVLTEKIKLSPERIALPRNSPGAEPHECSYLLEATRPENIWPDEAYFCATTSGHHIAFVYPSSPSPTQQAFVEQFIKDTEMALWQADYEEISQRIDLEVFADYFLFQELFQNIDGLIRSMFIQKQAEGRLLVWPIWDLDLTLRDDQIFEGWYLLDRPWIGLLLHCQHFRKLLGKRWRMLRTSILSSEKIDLLLMSTTTEIREAAVRNLERWPSVYEEIGAEPSTPPEDLFIQHVELLRTRLQIKGQWMDKHIQMLVEESETH